MSSTDRQYFHDMYRSSPDPWDFATSAYEQRKYAITMASLPRDRYCRAFEPGCSIGVLTQLLAGRCDDVLATDIVDVAIQAARSRVGHLGNVSVEHLAIPEAWPPGEFDLVVMSELAYYFEPSALDEILALTVDSTSEGAHLVGVHWRGPTNYPLSAEASHQRVDRCEKFFRVVHHEDDQFLLDVWERTR